MLGSLKKKLKKMGVSSKQIGKLMALSNPETAKRILCQECYDRMFMSAHSGQMQPQVLMDRICAVCKVSLENYLQEE